MIHFLHFHHQEYQKIIIERKIEFFLDYENILQDIKNKQIVKIT